MSKEITNKIMSMFPTVCVSQICCSIWRFLPQSWPAHRLEHFLYVALTYDVLALNKELPWPLKNFPSVIRCTRIHPHAVQRLNICGFN